MKNIQLFAAMIFLLFLSPNILLADESGILIYHTLILPAIMTLISTVIKFVFIRILFDDKVRFSVVLLYCFFELIIYYIFWGAINYIDYYVVNQVLLVIVLIAIYIINLALLKKLGYDIQNKAVWIKNILISAIYPILILMIVMIVIAVLDLG